MALEFLFDKKSQRYRYKDSGKFVSKDAIASLTQKHIDQVSADATKVIDLLIDKKISVSTWESTTAQTIKELSIAQYILGKGGIARMEQKDYGEIGYLLKQQYKYLRGFSEDLLAGNLTESQARSRLQQYINDGRTLYEAGRREAHLTDNFTRERRIRTKADSCSECIDYAARGWVEIGTLPAIGSDCSCKSNCGCRWEFSKTDKTDSILTQDYGWLKPRSLLPCTLTHDYRRTSR